jgi:uncharacterized protein (UPF0332 family)
LTPENRKSNIQEELLRARESLEAAEVLFEKKLFSDGASRVYYHVFHLVRALLLTKGLEPKSHQGLLRLLGLHFVKQGFLDPSDSHIVARLMKYREEADYNPSWVFTAEDACQLMNDARQLEGKISRLLETSGTL